jgi:outer membrane protein assembly factor BamB
MARHLSRIAWATLATIVATFAISAPGTAQIRVGEEETPRLFPLAPRELRQPLARASEAIAEQQYSDAVRELATILNNPSADDYFLAPEEGDDFQTSLRTAAQQMLGNMPAKGRDLYELQSGAEGRAMLDEALEQGDVQKLADVSRRYFHTKAGYEATLLLGKHHLDHGRPLAAALMLQRVAENPTAAKLYDPELSVMLAGAWNLAGMSDNAQNVLVQLKQRQPNTKISLGDKSVPLFSTSDKALAWLEELVGDGGLGRKLLASEWVMFRGNETRNASTSGSLPVLNFRWTVPMLNDPQDEQRARQIAKQRIDRDDVIIPALQPLAVKDYILARTPDRLLGIDLKTGKRVWVSWWEDSTESKSLQQTPQPAANPVAAERENKLRQRIWEDGLFGQLSSDGEQVYVVDDLPVAPNVVNGVPRGVWFGARGAPNAGQFTNRLRSLDLRSQGKLKWVIGGANGEDEPSLAGAFFVGPPLPIAGQLYALAEFNGELRLLCLNAKTGALEWKQQVAILEDPQQIRADSLRRLASATPSFADGVLVCPTSAGGVVAIDLATRSLRWGYQYPRWDLPQQRFNGAFVPQSRNGSDGQHWLDSSVTIVDGKVLLTPIESKSLHCLDLLTGESVWTPVDRGDMLYVACVHNQKIVMVGKDEVRSINLKDGKPGAASISLEGETPTGRGYYSDKYYYLPTSGSQLLKIDLDEAKIVSRAKTEIPLGNLICYQDEMISVSPYWIASFYLSEPLRERVDAALKENPDDLWAVCSKAELLLQETNRSEALELLRHAHKLHPSEDRPRALLVKTILSLLRDDFAAHRELVDEAAALIEHPAQRRELLRLRARGLQDAGLLWESFVAYQQLGRELAEVRASAIDNGDTLETVERDLRVRPGRWMMGRLAAVFAAASNDVQEKMTAAIQADFNVAAERGTPDAYRQFVERYAFHPLADRARLALAERLLGAEQYLEAELLVNPLLTAADRSAAGQATALLASLYEKAKRPELAAQAYHKLGRDFAEIACRGEATGKQLAAAAEESKELRGQAPPKRWPGGKVETKISDAEANTRFVTFQSNFPVVLSQWEGIPSYALKATFDSQQYALMVRDSLGRPLVTASLRSSEGGYRRFYPVQNNGLTGKAAGHLLMVHLGPEIVAIDALQSKGDATDVVLWRQEMMLGDSRSQQNFYPQSRQVTNPILGSRLTQYDSTGQVNFSTGPLLPSGLCFQRGRQLMCIDPLNGQLLWERSPVEPSAELFGDAELLFVGNADKEEVTVLSATDGTIVGKRKLPKAEQRLTTFGRNVLSWSQQGAEFGIELKDAWQANAPLWSKKVAQNSKGAIIDGDEFALLEPSGKLTVISLATGEVRFTADLEPEKNLAQLTVQRSSDRYIVVAHQQVTDPTPNLLVQPVNSSVGSTPVVHGRVYSLSHSGAKLWPVPAFVTQHYLLRDQPAELPFLFFLRNTRGASDARWSTQTLVLDKRTGGIVMEGELAPNQTQSAEVVADVAQSQLTLKVWFSPGFKTTTFKLTDLPSAPQPPAQTGNQSSLSVGESRGTISNVAGAVFRTLNRRARAGLQPLDPNADPFGPEPAAEQFPVPIVPPKRVPAEAPE